MYEGPEFRHLRYFIAVAEECNIGRAAKRLHVSQPALSLQIHQLEEALDAPLFIRGAKGTTLAPAGRAFLPFARQLLELQAHAVKAVSTAHTGIDLPLRFGYSPCINHDLVEELIHAFHEVVPGGEIASSSDTSAQLESMVVSGKLEAALVGMPLQHPNLFTQTICEEEMLICLRKDDPLVKQKALSKAAVEERLHVLFSRATQPLFYDDLIRRFMNAGIRLRPKEFVSAPSELQFLVRMSGEWGLISEATPLEPELTARRIEGFSFRMKTAFISNPEQQRPALPILGYRLVKLCEGLKDIRGLKNVHHRPIAA